MKKKSKAERREAKAAANRARAAEPPCKGKKHKQIQPQASVKSSYAPRCATYRQFEEALARFEQITIGRFRVHDVPRPPAHDVIGAARATSEREWRAQWRRNLLVWHPDKWQALTERADDPDLLRELTASMTRAVLRVKQQGYHGGG